MVNNIISAGDTTAVSPQIFTIIVAAGTGNRFGGNIPKQFEMLLGRPVLAHSIYAFRSILPQTHIILVISPVERERWEKLRIEAQLPEIRYVFGGKTRTESVRNALEALRHDFKDGDIVMIHDGARPIVDRHVICDNILPLFNEDAVHAVVPATPLTDSIMTADADNALPVDRTTFVAVQTPQAFRAKTLVQAYDAMPADATMSDDASVIHKFAGAAIHTVEGSNDNIKITYHRDLVIAEMILSARFTNKDTE